MNELSANLKKLRLEKKLTQEQAAAQLRVSPQAISRWETGVTTPDVMLLPEIARLYGVLVDELFRPAARGYRNEAVRLLAVYERTGRHEDFMTAYEAFAKLMHSATAEADDWRSYGVLHEYMTYHCRDQAFAAYERAMELSKTSDPEIYHRTKRQKNLLRSRFGQDDACIAEQEAAVKANPDDAEESIDLALAYGLAERYPEALRVCEEALRRFPNESGLYTNAGDSLRALKRYDEAFAAWQRAYELDPHWQDALYSAAFCHEELGQFDKAAEVWDTIVRSLMESGLEEEAKWPREKAEEARKKALGK